MLLVLIAGSAVLNGLFLDRIPAWRQALFAVLAVAAYLHGRHLPVRREWVLLAAVALSAAGYAIADLWAGVGALLTLGVFVALPWLAGRFRRQQAYLVQAGVERVAHLERERQFVADRARLLERARIAADMHDALGHELALIALQAGALELASDNTEGNREAAAKLRASAVVATDRLRHTVSRLRTAPDPMFDQSLDTLVDRARDAGMNVRLHGLVDRVTGSAPTDRAVHRVVQEALTNAARHAPGADVDIRVERTDDTITVTVRNPVEQPSQRSEPGTGIVALHEYIGTIGGTLCAQAREGAFTVTAHLPAAPAAGAERR
ncbi:histidine kinase [Verrucosispora sp. ts21]|uniref:sensor histidine kinase n=1 Tax=Verrucosispora sp. ts21 TaxID=2069341 RepID=UPI0018EE0027|nr:histidine kinase [Verrucosispora sp. ts21]